MARNSRHRWCLLIHSLPTRPLYLRARIRRQLSQAGAAPLKKAVYVLPHSEDGLRRLREIAAEVDAAGASAFVCEATFPDEADERAVIRACNAERHAQYQTWMKDAKSAGVGRRKRGEDAAPGGRIARLRERLAALRADDPFEAPGAAAASALLAHLERRGAGRPAASRGRSALVGLRWVTRRGLHVDRLACAWVVRRFLDPSAEFRFAASPTAPVPAGEIGFDFPGADITHEDGLCSVEVLVRRAGLRDRAVGRIAEIVHDMDLKDARYGHPETAGFERLLVGTISSHARDEDRLERGFALFDALRASLGHGALPPAAPATLKQVRVPPQIGGRNRK